MSEYKNAHEKMNQATDKAAEKVKGVGFSDTKQVLGEFDQQIDEASELASAKNRQKK